MSVFIAKVLSSAVHPLNLAIYLWLFAALLKVAGLKRLALSSAAIATLWLTFWSTPGFVEPIVGTWEQRYGPNFAESYPDSDLIVVLGGGVLGTSKPQRPMPELAGASDRVWFGAQLYNQGKAPRVLVTGGTLPWSSKTSPESEAMLAFLVDLGVPAEAVLLESDSQTTYDNARFSAPIVNGLEVKRAHLVTSAFHMQRSLAVFEKQLPAVEWIPASTDIKVVPRQASIIQWLPDVQTLKNAQAYLRERIGIWVYGYRGWL